MLLANNLQKVYCNQVVAEIKKDANLVLEEDRKDIYTEVSGEVFLQNVNLEESVDGEGATKKISKNTGLIWVLYGNKYTLQGFSKLDVQVGQQIHPNDTIASHRIRNRHSGVVSYQNLAAKNEIEVINASMMVANGTIVQPSNTSDNLKLQVAGTDTTFHMHVKNNDILTHGQTIACLEEETYKTQTGGIVYYSTDLGSTKKETKCQTNFYRIPVLDS